MLVYRDFVPKMLTIFFLGITSNLKKHISETLEFNKNSSPSNCTLSTNKSIFWVFFLRSNLHLVKLYEKKIGLFYIIIKFKVIFLLRLLFANK